MALAPATAFDGEDALKVIDPFDWARLLLVGNVAALLATAFALCAWHLDNIPGLNGDEAWSGVQAMRLVNGQSISWRTPTGNPVNLFYLGPLAALHLFAGPSVAVLRLPVLLAVWRRWRSVFPVPPGVWATHGVGRNRRIGGPTAQYSLLPVCVGCQPDAGCDHGLDVFGTTPRAASWRAALSLLVRRCWPSGRRSGFIRQTCLPDGCWLCPACLPTAVSWAGNGGRLRRGRLFWPLAAALGLAALAAAIGCRAILLPALARASDLSQWGLFFRLLIRLFSGSTIFEFIPGPNTGSTAFRRRLIWFSCAWRWRRLGG